jgi:1-acyl-sn-glycerol-3-phosphate acyltransferase
VTRRIIKLLLCSIIRLLFVLLTRVTTIGKGNLPQEGGYLAAANHLSMIEVPLVYCSINRNDVTGLVAKKHQKNAFFRWIVNSMGGIWINREEIDTRALKAARDHLRNGGVLGIAPEGTRSATGALLSAKTGVAYLADQAGVPIVPVAVSGTWQITQELFTLKRPRITLRFGEPFMLSVIDRSDREAGLRRNTDEIMCRIAVLLPAEYRGVYAQHPRVLELLESQINP